MSLPSSIRAHLARLWRIWLLIAASVIALASFVSSVWPRAPLSSRSGYAEAVAAMTADPNTMVVAVIDIDVLDTLPAHVRATDTVPQSPPPNRLAIVGEHGFRTPAELDNPAWRGVPSERQRFDDVDVLWLGAPR